MGGVDDELVEALALRVHQPGDAQPVGRDAAGRGLPLADLVAVEEQDVGAGAGQLAGHREPGEAGAADQHVVAPAPAGSARRRVWSPAQASPQGIDSPRGRALT